jgi:hypothetical protein
MPLDIHDALIKLGHQLVYNDADSGGYALGLL